MNNLKAYHLSFTATILRFYLMMAVIIIAGFSGFWWLGFLALPIFLSIMMGAQFKYSKRKTSLNVKSSHTPSLNFPKNNSPKMA